MRSFQFTAANLNQFIIDPLKADVFVHTWTNRGHVSREKDPNPRIAVNATQLRAAYHNLKYFQIEDARDDISESWRGVTIPKGLVAREPMHWRGSIPNFYSIYTSMELKREFERQNGFQYDVVIKIRPDLLVTSPVSEEALHDVLSRDLLVFSSLAVTARIQVSDKFAMGNSKVMDYYASAWLKLNDYWQNWTVYSVGERLLRKHMDHSSYETRQSAFASVSWRRLKAGE